MSTLSTFFAQGKKSQRTNVDTFRVFVMTKSSFEQVFLNSFCWVPDSRHREEGKSSRELFGKVRVNAVFFWYFGIVGGFFRPLFFSFQSPAVR